MNNRELVGTIYQNLVSISIVNFDIRKGVMWTVWLDSGPNSRGKEMGRFLIVVEAIVESRRRLCGFIERDRALQM